MSEDTKEKTNRFYVWVRQGLFLTTLINGINVAIGVHLDYGGEQLMILAASTASTAFGCFMIGVIEYSP